MPFPLSSGLFCCNKGVSEHTCAASSPCDVLRFKGLDPLRSDAAGGQNQGHDQCGQTVSAALSTRQRRTRRTGKIT